MAAVVKRFLPQYTEIDEFFGNGNRFLIRDHFRERNFPEVLKKGFALFFMAR